MKKAKKYIYPVKRKPSMKSEVIKSVAVGGLKSPTRDTFLTGFTKVKLPACKMSAYFLSSVACIIDSAVILRRLFNS